MMAFWTQVWPNLAANVIWVPLAAAHHLLTRRHARRMRDQIIDELKGRGA